MAQLHNDMTRLHHRIRRSGWPWPTQTAFDAHFLRRKQRYIGLPTACIQQAVRKFFGNLATARANRKNGLLARYPWRCQKRFATVPYRGDLVRWEGGRLTLGGGNGAEPLVIPMADKPGQILKAELRFDEVLVTVAVPAPGPRPAPAVPVYAAADPGQRWAWTVVVENGPSFMVHGRAIVSEKIRHAKQRGHQQAALAGKRPGSRRQRKIKRRMARYQAKSARRLRDLNHKVSRAVVDFGRRAGVSQLVLSQPQGIAQAPGRQAQRQRNGVWEYGAQTRLIAYKAEGYFEVIPAEERGTSSTCPSCARRTKPAGRTFRCPHCGFSAHRDLVGAGNQLGRHASHADVVALLEQTRPKYLRPWRPPQARSRVVETDRSPDRLEWPPDAPALRSGREWPAGDYAGRATPADRDRGREACRSTRRGAGKNLGVPSARPRTPTL
jgi:putative transposase